MGLTNPIFMKSLRRIEHGKEIRTGIKLTPYGKEVCGKRTSEDFDEIQDDKVERLWQALKGYKGMLTGRIRFWIRTRRE